jgi:hypothetical protein
MRPCPKKSEVKAGKSSTASKRPLKTEHNNLRGLI